MRLVRPVLPRARPPDVIEHNRPRTDKARAELDSTHPVRISNRRARGLTANRLAPPQVPESLTRNVAARSSSSDSDRSIELLRKAARSSEVEHRTAVVERPRRRFGTQASEQSQSVRIETTREMLLSGCSNDVPVFGVEVVTESFTFADNPRNREARLRPRIAVILRKDSPRCGR